MKWLRVMMVATILVAACKESRPIRLATTTSVDNSGLLEVLLTEFEGETGIAVDALAVGSGKAMRLVRRGDADMMITHDPAGERGFIDAESPVLYRKFMCSDFIIVGPSEDSANVEEAVSAIDAMARIASSDAPFASRGDRSGTHIRERQLWQLAGRKPDNGQVLESGQGMASTLRIASERQAYTLTDRATFLQLSDSLDLIPLFEGSDENLINCYAVTVPTSAHESSAMQLARWLTRGRGRDLIEAFEVGGERVFRLWPAEVPDDRPESLPK